MPTIAIWVLIVLFGLIAIGVAESVRSGRWLSGVNWNSVKLIAMAAAIAVLSILAGVLAISWTIVVLLAEIWQPFLIAAGASAGMVAMVTTYSRHRSMFYASAFATIAVVLLLFL